MKLALPGTISPEVRAAIRQDDDILGRLAPDSAHLAVYWLTNQDDDSYQVVAFIIAGLALLFGVGLIAGDWYTSIQGIRSPMVDIGLVKREHLWSFPGIYWWPLPVVLTISQVIPRIVKGARILWWPSTIFNAVTTGLFVAMVLSVFAEVYGIASDVTTIGIIASVIGLGVSVISERLFLFGLLVLRCAIKWEL